MASASSVPSWSIRRAWTRSKSCDVARCGGRISTISDSAPARPRVLRRGRALAASDSSVSRPVLYAEVAVHTDAPYRHPFTYSIPPELSLQPGHGVVVPFGQRTLQGIVL